ncbi:MAG: hypothetical protein AAFN43_09160, partial [Pseudomonadota bacterium]
TKMNIYPEQLNLEAARELIAAYAEKEKISKRITQDLLYAAANEEDLDRLKGFIGVHANEIGKLDEAFAQKVSLILDDIRLN